jgi:hypothetical protein
MRDLSALLMFLSYGHHRVGHVMGSPESRRTQECILGGIMAKKLANRTQGSLTVGDLKIIRSLADGMRFSARRDRLLTKLDSILKANPDSIPLRTRRIA